MRLLRFINEMSTNISVQEALEIAVKKCSPYLKQVVKKGGRFDFMYSGRTHNAYSFMRVVQQERHPLDTPKLIHMQLDRLFKKRWGVKYRSQSIFCTGNLNHASLYGTPFMVFPVGNFKFLWNPKFKDLFNYIRYDIAPSIDTNSIEGAEEFEKGLEGVIDTYQNSGLPRAIKSGYEIMVHCKEYMALDQWTYEQSFLQFFGKYGIVEPTTERLQALWELEGLDNNKYNGIQILK